ncbi:3-hydroxyacyl-CoA dehydrogenase [Roseospira marina]|uniref:3-hydroxyacyl-CoA dehydrogenase n=1 Tax=Roseospira marina TaxID=140057 RepID=A0A5M6ICY6_9PROT|nr:3-hydroxyacyl-CoA dehydrogenase NAD-binding domain-containing protein [Roseospira marina]KAA5606140.1 3-hydroxyacyl-CoA dehydrogenase [Roseospira marina]MBB4314279.1 3-hydroxybutyryl-CoA dehydrogenase [Roseospira marina]MBB5087439.1 3-hydroxybutyryl-CoA dehydrogenase [Roseospira marina]
MTSIATDRAIGVVGAGTMGGGIAQVAAAAGHPVRLFDAVAGAADAGKARIAEGLAKVVARGKMTAAARDALLGRIETVAALDAMADAALVLEAIVEDLDAKRQLFTALEEIVGPDVLLATNTSSLSVTAIARPLARPERLIGLHFFNPAPIMKLVEVISGVATAPTVAATAYATAEAWGKIAVHAKSTPGFIVNRVARPYYAEALRLYEEQVADPATLDALLTEGAGFRMGPFALMDLIGHDVNYAVCRSVFDAFYQDPRFRPSITQLELVNAGRLGRKTGQGVYSYAAGAAPPRPATLTGPSDAPPIPGFDPAREMEVDGVLVTSTDGRTAARLARARGTPVVVCDLITPETGRRLGFATSPDVPDAVVHRLRTSLDALGIVATRLPDWPGLVVMRTIAMLANEGFEAVMQGVADEAGVDAAMRSGVNYPKGPIGWGREIGLGRVLATLDHIHAVTGDPRYRASMALRFAAEA